MSDTSVFNEQLLQVVRSGVPIVLGKLRHPIPVAAFLTKLSEQLSQEKSLEEAWTSLSSKDMELQKDYARAFAEWKKNGHRLEALDTLHELGLFESDAKWNHSKFMAPLLVLVTLIAAGLSFMGKFVYPELQETYAINNLEPTASLRMLAWLHAYSEIWIGISIAAVLVLCFVGFFGGLCCFPLYPGQRRTLALMRMSQMFKTGEKPNEFSAALYRVSLENAVRFWFRWTPLIGATVVGGLLVVAYGLCLFWPFTDLLYQLSKP